MQVSEQTANYIQNESTSLLYNLQVDELRTFMKSDGTLVPQFTSPARQFTQQQMDMIKYISYDIVNRLIRPQNTTYINFILRNIEGGRDYAQSQQLHKNISERKNYGRMTDIYIYYVDTPKRRNGSPVAPISRGQLLLHNESTGRTQIITPERGLLVHFTDDTWHEVLEDVNMDSIRRFMIIIGVYRQRSGITSNRNHQHRRVGQNSENKGPEWTRLRKRLLGNSMNIS